MVSDEQKMFYLILSGKWKKIEIDGFKNYWMSLENGAYFSLEYAYDKEIKLHE